MSTMYTHAKGFGTPLIVVVVAVVVLGAGAYFVTTSSEHDAGVSEVQRMEGENMEAETENQMESEKTTLSDMDSSEGENVQADDSMMEDELSKTTFKGEVLAGDSAQLLVFNQADYEKALAEKKVVVLFFYANWCPVCRDEFPRMEDAFDALDSTDVIGFRVNYNDNETDDAEEALAREFGIAYQHTKVILRDGERVLKTPTVWSEEQYVSEITKTLNS